MDTLHSGLALLVAVIEVLFFFLEVLLLVVARVGTATTAASSKASFFRIKGEINADWVQVEFLLRSGGPV